MGSCSMYLSELCIEGGFVDFFVWEVCFLCVEVVDVDECV